MRISFNSGTMKGSLVVSIVLLFLILSHTTAAQVQEVERHAPPMEQLPQEQNQLVVSYDNEIDEEELPQKVITSLNDNYPGFEPTEILRGSDGSYNVKLEKDDEKLMVFYDAGGEFMRVENDTDNDDTIINDDWR